MIQGTRVPFCAEAARFVPSCGSEARETAQVHAVFDGLGIVGCQAPPVECHVEAAKVIEKVLVAPLVQNVEMISAEKYATVVKRHRRI